MTTLRGALNVLGSSIATSASAMLYGNGAGLVNNRHGRRIIADAKAYCALPAPAEPAARIAEILRHKGRTTVDPGYDESLLSRLQSTIRDQIDDPALSSRFTGATVDGNEEPARRLKDPLGSVPECRALVNRTVKEIVSAYFGSYFRIVEVSVWRNRHIPSRDVDAYSNVWHFDSLHTAHLKLFVNFTDRINRDSGAFRAHSLAHTRKIARSGYLERRLVIGPAAQLIEDTENTMFLEGGLGAACMANTTLCLHRAGVPGPGQYRDMASFVFVPSTRPLPDDWSVDRAPDQDAL